MSQLQMTSEDLSTKYNRLTEQGQKGLVTLSNSWQDTARDAQVTPHGDWDLWLILAGRGWGKTRTGATIRNNQKTAGRNRTMQEEDIKRIQRELNPAQHAELKFLRQEVDRCQDARFAKEPLPNANQKFWNAF